MGFRPIEDHHGEAPLGGGLEHVAERGLVREEADAGVGEVEDEDVEVAELLRRGARALAVEAVHGEPRALVAPVAHRPVGAGVEAVLGAEEGFEAHARRRPEHVDGALPTPVDAARVRDQADAAATEGREAVALQDVDPGEHVPPRRRAAERTARHHGGHLAPEAGAVALPVRVQAAREHDDRRVRAGVDPDRRAREAGVPVPSRPAGERRQHVPAQRALRAARELVRRGHRADRRARQDLLAAQAALAEEHRGEAREVSGRGEEAGVPGDAAQEVGAWVVDLARQHLAVAPLGGRGACDEGGARQERRVAHAERREDVLAGEDVEGLPGDGLDQLAEDDEPHVAVRVRGPRRARGGERVDARQSLRPASPVVGEGVVGDEPAGVEEELFDGDRTLAVRRERGEVPRDRRPELQPALLREEVDARRRGDDLGERRQVEHRVDHHRPLLRLLAPQAVGPEEDGLAPVDDGDHGARHLAARHRAVRGLVDGRHGGARDGGCGGGGHVWPRSRSRSRSRSRIAAGIGNGNGSGNGNGNGSGSGSGLRRNLGHYRRGGRGIGRRRRRGARAAQENEGGEGEGAHGWENAGGARRVPVIQALRRGAVHRGGGADVAAGGGTGAVGAAGA